MRIAFLAYRGNMQSGGQGVYLHHLTEQLAQRGHEIDCFVGPPQPDPMPWARVTPIENHHFWGARFAEERSAFLPRPDPFRIFHPLNFYEYCVTRFGFLPEPFAFSLRGARGVVERMRAGVRYDIVHDVQSLGYGLLWLRALGLPVVSTVHHPLTVDRRSSLQLDRSFKDMKGTLTFYPVRTQARVARRVDAILTSSEASAREIESGFRVRRDRMHLVANGVELPAMGPPRTRRGDPELLFVGRCGDPNKGLGFLLSALALLPPPVRLRVLDTLPSNSPLEAQLRELHLEHRVSFEGKVPKDELLGAYRAATVVVVPSLFEGFGLPLVEALAVGTPVVATTAGALPELAERVGAGHLVPPADPAALAKGVGEVLESWDAQHRAARAARPRIETAYGWPEIARRTEAVYASLLSRG